MQLQGVATFFCLLRCAVSTLQQDERSIHSSKALNVRSPTRELLNLATAEPTLDSRYFVVTGFEAFISSPAYQKLHSWTVFNVTLVHRDFDQRFSTLCKARTNGALYNHTDYTACEPIKGVGHENENLSFRFSQGLDNVDILWVWQHQSIGKPLMHLKTWASEGTYWDESVDGGNVTVSQFGKYYHRAAEWVLPFRQTVG